MADDDDDPPLGGGGELSAASPPAALEWPQGGALTREWVDHFAATLEYASRNLQPSQLPEILPLPVADALIATASKIMHHEPNCLDLRLEGLASSVVLVGDVHGQLHDVLHLLEVAGFPADDRVFIFNGDYVDRGAWGLETYLLLLAWKILLPHAVFLLRGNHETKYCTSAYGFEQEVIAKYGSNAKHLYHKLLGCFHGHPLAALVAGDVFMAHGGLFRCSEPAAVKKKKGAKSGRRTTHRETSDKVLKLGNLHDLAKARRGVMDPSHSGSNPIPGDVLWSDPSNVDGLTHNSARGIGLLFGPDCTQEFLEKNNLKLIVRSHEGPDARDKRSDMAGMDKGYTIDHVVKAGKLVTLFSAPDYPQFQATKHRYNNKGAYIVLEPPDYSIPNFHVFEAVHPRPKVKAYYDYVNAVDSDDDLSLGGDSDASGSSDTEIAF